MQNPRHQTIAKTFPSELDMKEWSKAFEKLSSFTVSILRATDFGTVEWKRKGDKWEGGVVEGKGSPAAPAS